jgi:hypothetical protein
MRVCLCIRVSVYLCVCISVWGARGDRLRWSSRTSLAPNFSSASLSSPGCRLRAASLLSTTLSPLSLPRSVSTSCVRACVRACVRVCVCVCVEVRACVRACGSGGEGEGPRGVEDAGALEDVERLEDAETAAAVVARGRCARTQGGQTAVCSWLADARRQRTEGW